MNNITIPKFPDVSVQCNVSLFSQITPALMWFQVVYIRRRTCSVSSTRTMLYVTQQQWYIPGAWCVPCGADVRVCVRIRTRCSGERTKRSTNRCISSVTCVHLHCYNIYLACILVVLVVYTTTTVVARKERQKKRVSYTHLLLHTAVSYEYTTAGGTPKTAEQLTLHDDAASVTQVRY